MYQSVIRDPGGSQMVRVVTKNTIVNGSILLVPADTIAFFVCNGQVSEPYRPGRWEIQTGISPFFVRLRHMMTAGDTGTSFQVWYVNTQQENCKHGGTGEVIFQEQRFKISMRVRAAYSLRFVISNPRAFITKLVGMHKNDITNEDLLPAVDAMILPHLKKSISRCISTHSVYEFQNDLVALGNELRPVLNQELESYGLSVRGITMIALNVSDVDFAKLAKLEEEHARGTMATDLEVDNIERVWTNVNNRTMAEMLTGSLRGPGRVNEGATTGMAGMMQTLPMQMALANQAMEQMAEPINHMMSHAGGANRRGQRTPPPVPPRPCRHCGRNLEDSDAFCRYCGGRQ